MRTRTEELLLLLLRFGGGDFLVMEKSRQFPYIQVFFCFVIRMRMFYQRKGVLTRIIIIIVAMCLLTGWEKQNG